MSVIIRLQNLPWAANAADIRQYFQGLSIPEGGVHIVGGEKGDAFISFSTDEDARQAMLSDGGCIKDIQIRLLLSSRNEMQKVIETARQQSMQYTQQVYMQQLQQPPQMPLVGSLPPLTAKVLPQPQQQVRPDRMVNMLRRNQPIMDAAGMLMVPVDNQLQLQQLQQQQQQHQQQQQQLPHLSPKSLEIKDRDDKGHKRERTRSKSRDRRSKSTRSGGGGRRERSRSRDRRRRDRSRGRDRSRDRHRSGGGRDSSSRGSGGKSHRSRSPVGGGKAGGDPQQASVRSWNCQFDNGAQQPHAADDRQTGPGGAGPMMFGQFRAPSRQPVVGGQPPNAYNGKQPPNDWTMGGGGEQQPYVPDNGFPTNAYGGAGSDDDEDDRQAEYDNNYHRRYNNDNTVGGGPPGVRRGPPGQDFNQHGFGGGPNNRGGPRFHHKQQPGGPPNRGGGPRQFDDFRGGGGGGPRFNSHHHQQQQQQPPRYGGRGGISDGGGGRGGISDGGGRPSRFSSVHEGGRPSRFNPATPQRRNNDVEDAEFSADDSGNNKRLAQPPTRFNDRYRYDVRNAVAPQQQQQQQQATASRVDGLCVEVNNMSNHFSYGDVRKLFDGIHIDGSAIKIQKHRNGVAFVRFDNNHNKNLALQVSGNLYKGSHIVVKHLDDEAYERDNTDDRPYPSAGTAVADAPTIVDHVDLVDDDDDEEGEDSKKTPAQQKKTDDAVRGDSGGDEKNAAPAAAAAAATATATKDTTAADGEERNNKTQQQQQKPDPPTKYLQLKQLPITVTEEEVLNEIDGGGDVRRVTFYPDGEFMGALLEFTCVDAAEATLKRFDCVLLGSTPVPVLRCSYKEYVQIKRSSGGGGRRFSGEGGGSGGRHHQHHHHHHHHAADPSSAAGSQPPVHPVPPVIRSNCLYVYGLPTTVTNTDIMQFFGETSVLPDKIHIMLSKFSRPTGESYCEFGTAQQAQTALAKDQSYMGPNLVYVEPISRSVMIQAITKPMQQHNNPQHNMSSWGGGGMRGGGGGGPRQPHNNMSGPRQPQHHHGGGGGGPAQQQPSYGGGGGHNAPYGGGRPQYVNNGGGRGGGGGGYAPRMRGPGPGPNTGPDGFGQPGCVVALDNVPYRADVQEIVDFFDGFELNSQNVIRRFNDFGKPTGEARVNLRNPQEAARAVRALQNKPIFNRPLRLTLL